jgi:hypothetical protein
MWCCSQEFLELYLHSPMYSYVVVAGLSAGKIYLYLYLIIFLQDKAHVSSILKDWYLTSETMCRILWFAFCLRINLRHATSHN